MEVGTVQRELTIIAVLSVAALTVVGCTSTPTVPPSEASAQTERPTPAVSDCGTSTNAEARTNQTAAWNPVRIALFQDKSGSSDTTRTAQLTQADLSAPISLLRCTGGELAVGVVDNVSKKSLARLRIEVPPWSPSTPAAANVFVRANEDAVYQQRLKDYQKDVEKWAAETDKRVEIFLAQVAELLKQPATANRTSVWNAVARADLMLNESDVTWPQPTHRYAVLNSDCQETAGTNPVAVKSGAQWIVVNGAGSVGIADALNPERFENPVAAFEFIKAKELRGK
jgi:hypothetical protein